QQSSSDAALAAIAAKALKEARYHQQHSGDWVIRLGDGTAESKARMQAALAAQWRFVPELFDTDAVDAEAAANGIGPLWHELQAPWQPEIDQILGEAGLVAPATTAFRSEGKRGRHSEHMGFILSDMQH